MRIQWVLLNTEKFIHTTYFIWAGLHSHPKNIENEGCRKRDSKNIGTWIRHLWIKSPASSLTSVTPSSLQTYQYVSYNSSLISQLKLWEVHEDCEVWLMKQWTVKKKRRQLLSLHRLSFAAPRLIRCPSLNLLTLLCRSQSSRGMEKKVETAHSLPMRYKNKRLYVRLEISKEQPFIGDMRSQQFRLGTLCGNSNPLHKWPKALNPSDTG